MEEVADIRYGNSFCFDKFYSFFNYDEKIIIDDLVITVEDKGFRWKLFKTEHKNYQNCSIDPDRFYFNNNDFSVVIENKNLCFLSFNNFEETTISFENHTNDDVLTQLINIEDIKYLITITRNKIQIYKNGQFYLLYVHNSKSLENIIFQCAKCFIEKSNNEIRFNLSVLSDKIDDNYFLKIKQNDFLQKLTLEIMNNKFIFRAIKNGKDYKPSLYFTARWLDNPEKYCYHDDIVGKNYYVETLTANNDIKVISRSVKNGKILCKKDMLFRDVDSTKKESTYSKIFNIICNLVNDFDHYTFNLEDEKYKSIFPYDCYTKCEIIF